MVNAVISEGSLEMFLSLLHFNSFTCITRIIIWFAVRITDRVAGRSGVRSADWLAVRIADRVAGRSGVRSAAWFAVRIADRVAGRSGVRSAAWFAVRIANRATGMIADRVADWLAVRIAVIKIISRFTSMVDTRFSVTINTKIV